MTCLQTKLSLPGVLAGEIDTYELEKRYIRKNGEVIYTLMSAGCVRNPDQSVDYFVALLQDITIRKLTEFALRESEEKYRHLYESIKDNVITTDLDGNILDCNQACLDMLGYTMSEMRSLTFQQLTPVKWHALDDHILKTQINTSGYSDEYEKEYIA